MFVEVWLHHYSLEMYQKLQSPQVKVRCSSSSPSPSGLLTTPPCGHMTFCAFTCGLRGSSDGQTVPAGSICWASSHTHVLTRLCVFCPLACPNISRVAPKPARTTWSTMILAAAAAAPAAPPRRRTPPEAFRKLTSCLSHWTVCSLLMSDG